MSRPLEPRRGTEPLKRLKDQIVLSEVDNFYKFRMFHFLFGRLIGCQQSGVVGGATDCIQETNSPL